MDHKPGVLSGVLDLMALNQANILTINQGVPINDAAMVTLIVDISEMQQNIKELIQKLLKEENVIKAEIIGME